MGKDKREKIEEKAKVALAKAEKLMDKERGRRAAEKFMEAGDLYFEIGEWRIAERCYYYSAKNYVELKLFEEAANLFRLAANCALLMHDFAQAKNYYRESTKSILLSDSKRRDFLASSTLAFMFLCEFIRGHQDQALGYIKQYKSEIDPDEFRENLLIKLVHNLANAIYNQKESYLKEVLADYPKYKFRAAEKELINAGILVAMCSVYLKLDIMLDRTEFERDEVVDVDLVLDYHRLKEIMEHPLVPHKFESVVVKDVGIVLGDNLSVKERPIVPVELNIDDIKEDTIEIFPMKIRTNFPEKTSIGPIMFTIEIDKLFHFFIKSGIKKVQIVSPKAVLGVNLIPKETPVPNKTFPLEVVVFNRSEGDAQNITVKFEFPDELKMMRGTFEKNIYALSANEEVSWIIQVKALDSGEIPITTIVQFEDGDGNVKGPMQADIPIMINL